MTLIIESEAPAKYCEPIEREQSFQAIECSKIKEQFVTEIKKAGQ
jgi:hypothetical protein